jgi:hypothetical protein
MPAMLAMPGTPGMPEGPPPMDMAGMPELPGGGMPGMSDAAAIAMPPEPSDGSMTKKKATKRSDPLQGTWPKLPNGAADDEDPDWDRDEEAIAAAVEAKAKKDAAAAQKRMKKLQKKKLQEREGGRAEKTKSPVFSGMRFQSLFFKLRACAMWDARSVAAALFDGTISAKELECVRSLLAEAKISATERATLGELGALLRTLDADAAEAAYPAKQTRGGRGGAWEVDRFVARLLAECPRADRVAAFLQDQRALAVVTSDTAIAAQLSGLAAAFKFLREDVSTCDFLHNVRKFIHPRVNGDYGPKVKRVWRDAGTPLKAVQKLAELVSTDRSGAAGGGASKNGESHAHVFTRRLREKRLRALTAAKPPAADASASAEDAAQRAAKARCAAACVQRCEHALHFGLSATQSLRREFKVHVDVQPLALLETVKSSLARQKRLALERARSPPARSALVPPPEERGPGDAFEHAGEAQFARLLAASAGAEASFAGEVSVLLYTVTFYANLAHSLTRSP